MGLERGPGCRPGVTAIGTEGTAGAPAARGRAQDQRLGSWQRRVPRETGGEVGLGTGPPGSHCEKHWRLVDARREPRLAAHTGSGQGEGRAAGTEGGSLRTQVRLCADGGLSA